jgi:predicted transcriptional regulator
LVARCLPATMKAHALVARNVRRLRVRLGLSQDALSAEAGVNRAYVGRLERRA